MSDGLTTPDTCIIDGCDHAPTDLDAYRGHVNATADHPSWSEVKARLQGGDDQGDEGEQAGDEQGESPGSGDGEGDDQGTDQGESGDDDGDGDQEEPGNDQADSPSDGGEEGDVPTPEEYDDQHDQGTDQGESGDDDGDGDQGTQGKKQRDSPLSAWSALPVDPRTFLTIIAVATVAWLLYQAMTGDGTGSEGGSDPSEPVDTEAWNDTDTGTADDGGPVEGGLAQ